MHSMNISNNTTDGASEALTRFPPIPLSELMGISVCIFAVIGIIANGLVLLVMFTSQRKRFSTYRYLISHLALSDFLCSVMLIVYVPVELHDHDFPYKRYACKFVFPSITFFENLAIGTVIIISFERYKGVILPHWSAWKKYNVLIGLCIVWITGFVIVIPDIMMIKVTNYSNIHYCNEKWSNITLQHAYGISFFLIAFFIPSTSVAIMHTQIMCRLNRRAVRPSNVSENRNRNERRIIRVLTAIILAFFICTSPNKLLYLVWDISPTLEKSQSSHTRLYLRPIQILYHARVAVDPLLYCFFDTRFKQDLQNTKKTMRGMSVTESSEKTRCRTRTQLSTLSTQPGILDTASTLAIPHIHCEYSINNGFAACIPAQNVLTIIQEATALTTPIPSEVNVSNSDKRSRTESLATERTSVYGSSSPLQLSSHMTEL